MTCHPVSKCLMSSISERYSYTWEWLRECQVGGYLPGTDTKFLVLSRGGPAGKANWSMWCVKHGRAPGALCTRIRRLPLSSDGHKSAVSGSPGSPCLALWSIGGGWPPSEVTFVPSHGISVLQLRQREMPDFLWNDWYADCFYFFGKCKAIPRERIIT